MASTFDCPHCGAEYPFKPVLVGRAVRCTACKQAFRLREDGIADPVAPAAPQQPAAHQQPAPAQQQAPAPSPADQASAPEHPTAPRGADDLAAAAAAAAAAVEQPTSPAKKQASGRHAQSDRSEQVRRKHEQTRRTMASTLTSAASEALKSDVVRRETRRIQTRGQGRDQGRRSGSGTREIGPAVLTGAGEEEARTTRVWLLALAGAAVLVLLIVLLSDGGDPARTALAEYALVEDQGSLTQRMRALRERMWLYDSDQPVLTNLAEAEIGEATAYDLGPGQQWISENLAKHVLLSAPPVWIPEREQVKLAGADPQRRRQLLAEGAIPHRSAEAVAEALAQTKLEPEAAAALSRMLHGATDATGGNYLRTMFLAGRGPQRMELCPFSGDNGTLVTPAGRDRGLGYAGHLLRFPDFGGRRGDKDLDAWHIFDLTVTATPY